MMEVLIGVVAGALNGLGIACLGYAKSAKVEDFDERKFLQTAVVGAIVGAGAGYAGVTYQTATEWAASSGLIVIIEYIKKAVLRATGLAK